MTGTIIISTFVIYLALVCSFHQSIFKGSILRKLNKLYLNENDSSSHPCPLAEKCSGQYRSNGCDGSGKIQGGIGVYLNWWPIKVFRPCPSYLEAGYAYRREGQTMDQVLFSEPSTKMREKIEAYRAEQEAQEKVPEASVEPSGELSEEDKFLEEKFGRRN